MSWEQRYGIKGSVPGPRAGTRDRGQCPDAESRTWGTGNVLGPGSGSQDKGQCPRAGMEGSVPVLRAGTRLRFPGVPGIPHISAVGCTKCSSGLWHFGVLRVCSEFQGRREAWTAV